MKEIISRSNTAKFNKDEVTFNLNKESIWTGDFKNGTFQNLIVKCGRNYYYMDVVKHSHGVEIEIYNVAKKGKRNSFSKYDKEAETARICIDRDNIRIDRKLFERRIELSNAIEIINSIMNYNGKQFFHK